MITDMTQVVRIVPSTSSALLWMQWSWLGMWGIAAGPDTGNVLASMAKQLKVGR